MWVGAVVAHAGMWEGCGCPGWWVFGRGISVAGGVGVGCEGRLRAWGSRYAKGLLLTGDDAGVFAFARTGMPLLAVRCTKYLYTILKGHGILGVRYRETGRQTRFYL